MVAVQAGEGAAAGVEERGRPGRLPDHDIGGQHFVDRTLDPGQVGPRAHVEAHHLSPRVNTGVGTTGAGELDRVAQDTLEGLAEDAGHRRKITLEGKTVERGAQVSDEQPEPALRRVSRAGVSLGGFGQETPG